MTTTDGQQREMRFNDRMSDEEALMWKDRKSVV